MPDIPGTTRAQTLFLRAFRTHPAGPPPNDWPAPAILRKWLRKPAFRRALHTVQEALRFQTDFHLANAATTAARKLSAEHADLSTQDLNRLLRHAHLRQRFPAADAADAHPPDHDDDDSDQSDDPENNNSCITCAIRRRNPFWVEDKAAFKQAAFNEGYTAPLREWPDFPAPVPQDTFYYQLLQDTRALLWYMQRYDQHGNDHRYQPILMACKHLIPRDDNDLPRFVSERPTTPAPQ